MWRKVFYEVFEVRIVHVGKFYPPSFGGMERVVSELCEGLADRGHDVCAIVARDPHHDLRKQTKFRERARERINGVNVIRLKTVG